MYYCMDEKGIRDVSRLVWEESETGIAIFDVEEWTQELQLQEEFSIVQKEEHIFFCKLEQYRNYMMGVFHIPIKKKEKRSRNFAVYIWEKRLIFVEEDGVVSELAEILQKRSGTLEYHLQQFVDDFFMLLMEEDILYLADLEREVAEMEETVLQGNTKYFNYTMLGIKKEISRLYCYYNQMIDVGERLCEQKLACAVFPERVKRMQQVTQSLREYAMQVQDVYQSEISIHQNDITKVLTIVTTIFLPLSLIAAWYGMNFQNMPELRWKYGYPVVSAVSGLIVLVSLWFFKKKNFFR